MQRNCISFIHLTFTNLSVKLTQNSCSSPLIIKMVDPSSSRLSYMTSRSVSNHVWIMLPNGNGVQEDIQKYKLRGDTINTLNLYCVYENSQNYSKASMEKNWQESSQFTYMRVNLCHSHLWCQPATCLVFPLSEAHRHTASCSHANLLIRLWKFFLVTFLTDSSGTSIS